ncbi:MAG: 4Fe-4S dicluster domain-containing protein [Cyclobacteriaceae bacterium]
MSKRKKNTYWLDVKVAVLSASKGLVLTIIHLRDALTKKQRRGVGVESDNYFDYDKGITTLQYPKETLPVPDNGRYRLHNEIEDCIVCDKCAKVCPVDCIDIEAIKSPEEIRKTSDGSSVRLHAAKFDIDMAKCCYCGLCTTVCPTECLTMTKTYDYSEFDVTRMNYEFSDLTAEDVFKRQREYDLFAEAKEKAKEKAAADKKVSSSTPVIGKPAIPGAKPKIVIPKPATAKKPVIPAPKPSIPKPKIATGQPKVVIPKPKVETENGEAKPVIKPVIQKPKIPDAKPVMKPVIPKPKKKEGDNE